MFDRFFDLVEANRQREAIREEQKRRKRFSITTIAIGAATLLGIVKR